MQSNSQSSPSWAPPSRQSSCCSSSSAAATTRRTTQTTSTDGGQRARPGSRRSIVKDGQPEGGVQDLEFTAGENVRFEVLGQARGDPRPRLRRDDGRRARQAVSVRRSRPTSRASSRSSSRSRRPDRRADGQPRLTAMRRRLAPPRWPLRWGRSPRRCSSRRRVGAHALVGKQDLPIPQWLFAWGASLVLIVSFVALTLAWRAPRSRTRAGGRRRAGCRGCWSTAGRGRSRARSASSCSAS